MEDLTPISSPLAAREPWGYIRLLPDKCTVCMICVRECPDWCIHIEGHVEPVPPPNPDDPAAVRAAQGRRERSVTVLDRFAIDYGSCLYCGICINSCPFDALEWVAPPDASSGVRSLLVHEASQLAEFPDHREPTADG